MRFARPCLAMLLASWLGGCVHIAEPAEDGWVTRVTSSEADDWRAITTPAGSTKDQPKRRVKRAQVHKASASKPARRWARPSIVRISRTEPAPEAPAIVPVDDAYLLDTGDQLRIFVYGQQNLSRIYKVDQKGRIMMPLIGIVSVRGHSTYAVARIVRDRLGARYVRDPQVTVDIHENRPFFIFGEVKSPGKYPFVSGMTVETAVAIAGGYTPRASEAEFKLKRVEDGVIQRSEVGRDHVVQPGDTIRVLERFF